MAYNAQTGLWEKEDDDVAKAVSAVVDPNNPLMIKAKQTGIDYANSRGLLNSSIAGGAAQAETYKVALPIGTQQSQQTHQKNLSGQDFAQTGVLETGRQKAAADLQREQSASSERIAAAAQAGETTRTGLTLSAAEQRQLKDLQSSEANQRRQIESTEAIAARDSANKLALQEMDVESRKLIAQMNVTANSQDKAMNAALYAANVYAGMVNNINSNPNIPAESRAALLENARREQAANIALTERIYNLDLQWGTAAAPAAAPSTGLIDPASNFGGTGTPATATNTGGGGIQRQADGSYIDANGNKYDANNVYVGGGYYGFQGRDPNDPNDTN